MQWCAAGGMSTVLAQPSVLPGQGDGRGLRRERSLTACWQSTSVSEASREAALDAIAVGGQTWLGRGRGEQGRTDGGLHRGCSPLPVFQLLDMKVFVDTDSDIRLVRRLQRDIMERGRDIVGVIKQYNKFVKPAFEQYIEPTVQVADIVVPRGETALCLADLTRASGVGVLGRSWISVCLTWLLRSPVRWGELCGPGPHCAACAQPAGEGEVWLIAANAGEEDSARRGEDVAAHSPVLLEHPEALGVASLSLQKVLAQLLGQTELRHGGWGNGDRSGCSTCPGSGAWHLRSGLASFTCCLPRSQSALLISAVPTSLAPGCASAARPCLPAVPSSGFPALGLAPGEGVGVDWGCLVAVPGRCSDWVSFLSLFAPLDDSALPPSARSLSGMRGPCQPQRGRFLGWGWRAVSTCSSPSPASSLSLLATALLRCLSMAALHAVSWGVSRCGCRLLCNPSHSSYA